MKVFFTSLFAKKKLFYYSKYVITLSGTLIALVILCCDAYKLINYGTTAFAIIIFFKSGNYFVFIFQREEPRSSVLKFVLNSDRRLI